MVFGSMQVAALSLALWARLSLQSPAPSNQILARADTPTLNSLFRDVERVESVREVKDVQRSLSQLAWAGKWTDSAALFTDDGVLEWGKIKIQGRDKIEAWFKEDADAMDGIKPGSLNAVIAENPLINLASDGKSALGRWNGLRFQGDGNNKTRIQGGIYENQYALSGGQWKISLLKYYPMYDGQYDGGWRNVDGPLPIIPYHFTPEETGFHIAPPTGEPPVTKATADEIAHRITRLRDEDDVRNLQHAYGYYVDRRMWTDISQLFAADYTVKIDGLGEFSGATGARQALEAHMGPEGLTEGILNDHMVLSTIVKVDPSGKTAVARSTGLAMLGDTNKRAASWEFSIYRNTFVKENQQWKLKELSITPVITANYTVGWGNGGLSPRTTTLTPPAFVGISGRSSEAIEPAPGKAHNLSDLQRQLARASAFDGAENMSNAYGYYLDDIRCDQMGSIYADKGHKLSPFAGWYLTPRRITDACIAAYGNRTDPMRASISYHWRPQPVILTSVDGRSASLRARLFQPSTSTTSAGAFNGAIYHDQMVLENGRWKVWDTTIDEFYWMSNGWQRGWAHADKRPASDPDQPPPRLSSFPPDLTLVEVGERESTFRGGSGRYLDWPEIQRMWFAYRNPVSGQVPEFYWPGCVPCKTKPDWSLLANGYQEPPTGPTRLMTNFITSEPARYEPSIEVYVSGGPGEPVEGIVELHDAKGVVLNSTRIVSGKVAFNTPSLSAGNHSLIVFFPGSERLDSAQLGLEIFI
ncbi:hypothetical protein OQA88_8753 [Cercophora sp. LCS_1]